MAQPTLRNRDAEQQRESRTDSPQLTDSSGARDAPTAVTSAAEQVSVLAVLTPSAAAHRLTGPTQQVRAARGDDAAARCSSPPSPLVAGVLGAGTAHRARTARA